MEVSVEKVGVYLAGGHLTGDRGGDRRARWTSDVKLFGSNRLSKFLLSASENRFLTAAPPTRCPVV